MNAITILTMFGVLFGFLSLEILILILVNIPKVAKLIKTIKRKIKNEIRFLFWKNFDYKNNFVEKD